jgi:CBS domain-containing protein
MKKRDRIESIRTGRPAARHRTAKGSTRRRGSRAAVSVREVMVSEVVTIGPGASLVDAARTMEEANVGMLPVVEDARVRGLITDRDIVVRAVARGAETATTSVEACLTGDVVYAQPDWTTERALRAMSDAQVGRLPVVDEGGALVGVVTLSSLAFRAPDKQEALETARDPGGH